MERKIKYSCERRRHNKRTSPPRTMVKPQNEKLSFLHTKNYEPSCFAFYHLKGIYNFVLYIKNKHKIKMREKKKEVIRLEREAVIPILKHKLTTALSLHFGLIFYIFNCLFVSTFLCFSLFSKI